MLARCGIIFDMNFLVDSHCHLHDRQFFTEGAAEEALKNAEEMGVLQVICIGTDPKDSMMAKEFSERHAGVFWTYGVHPEEAEKDWGDFKFEKTEGLVAIGEVGLDYHYPGHNREKQIRLIETMLDLATKLELPCSFHVRDAFDDFFPVLDNFPKLLPSVFHSFSDSRENLEKVFSRGHFIGINGLITFANLECFREMAPAILERVVLETDAPFLTPVPKRGKINVSGNVKYVAEYLSDKLGVTSEEIAEKTTKNVQRIFNLPDTKLGA